MYQNSSTIKTFANLHGDFKILRILNKLPEAIVQDLYPRYSEKLKDAKGPVFLYDYYPNKDELIDRFTDFILTYIEHSIKDMSTMRPAGDSRAVLSLNHTYVNSVVVEYIRAHISNFEIEINPSEKPGDDELFVEICLREQNLFAIENKGNKEKIPYLTINLSYSYFKKYYSEYSNDIR